MPTKRSRKPERKQEQKPEMLAVQWEHDNTSLAFSQVDMGRKSEAVGGHAGLDEDLISFRFDANINHITYRVGVADFSKLGLQNDENPVEGLCLCQSAIILIDESVPTSRRQAVYWHEFGHALLGEIGPKEYAHMVGCKVKDAEDSEERLVTHLGTVLHGALGKPAIDKALE